MKNFNSYTWKARILPGVILISPWFVSFNLILGNELFDLNVLIGILPNAFLFAVGALIANLIRDFGKRKETALWKSWGGAPTTRYLRHRNTEFNKYDREKCHRFLGMRVSGLSMPTIEQEESNPADADEKYEACVHFLIQLARDTKKYPLVFLENKNYGFWRNMYGIKTSSVVLNIVLIITTILYCMCTKTSQQSLIIAEVVNILNLLFWLFVVKKKRVKLVAEIYARRLLEICINYQ